MRKFFYYCLVPTLLLCASAHGDCGQSCCNPCGCEPCDCDPCDDCTTCDSCCSSPCCCEPCDFVPPCPPDTCAYNAPVEIDIKCGWDIYVSASFLYYQAKEENLDYIILNEYFGEVGDAEFINSYGEMCFEYKPAFKVGVGINLGCDDWSFNLEYMRYHADAGLGSFNKSIVVENNPARLNTRAYLLWATEQGTEIADNRWDQFDLGSIIANTKWRLEMDLLDFNISRRYFVGQCLTFDSHVGLRAGWIDQKYNALYLIEGSSAPLGYVNRYNNEYITESWAIGPRIGLNTDWRFCGGFFLFGNTDFSILYTNYNKITLTEDILQSDGDKLNFRLSSPLELCFLRPQASIGLGLGWADYFCCNDWFFDFRIGYDCQVFWNQNVFANHFSDSYAPTSFGGDLYLHGLNITARLDF